MKLYYVLLCIALTNCFLEELGLTLPDDEYQVDRYTGQDHQDAVSCLDGTGVHGHHRHEDGGQEIDDGEDKRHAYGTRKIRLRPTQPRQTQDRHSDTQLKGL